MGHAVVPQHHLDELRPQRQAMPGGDVLRAVVDHGAIVILVRQGEFEHLELHGNTGGRRALCRYLDVTYIETGREILRDIDVHPDALVRVGGDFEGGTSAPRLRAE